MADLLKIAEVLEKAAAVIDVHEAEKTAAVKQERQGVVTSLSQKYAAATGEELPQDIAEKLAAGDQAVLKTVQNMVEKTAGAIESLGRSSDRADGTPRPMTKQDRAKAAWDRMGQFLNS
jgi:hypothetical protein